VEEKKEIALKELPDGKIRLFRSRDAVKIDTPKGVLGNSNIDKKSIPIAVEITPMTHRESEVRSRMKQAVDMANRLCNINSGVTHAEIDEYQNDASAVDSEVRELAKKTTEQIEKIAPDGTVELSTVKQTKIEELTRAFIEFKDRKTNELFDRHAKYLAKSNNRELTQVYDREDDLLTWTVQMVISNCKKLVFADREEVVTPDTLEMIHPDLFHWIVSEIEEISYLKSGEISGFR